MSHEVESNRFAFREGSEVPWHVEAGGVRDNRVPDADCYSFDRFMRAAHMDVTYRKVPVSLVSSTGGLAKMVPGLFAVQRAEDNLILPGVGVGSHYDILQPREAFEFFEPFLADKGVVLDCGGILRNGSRFFVSGSVAMAREDVTPGDTVKGYILFYTAVDGSLVTGIKFVVTRVVCANTLAVARTEQGPGLRVRHTKGQRATLKQIQEVMDVQSRTFSASVEQYRALARSAVVREDLERYVTLSLGFPVGEDLSKKASNIVDSVVDMAEMGRGTALPGTRGTAWGAYNAVTEYLSHEAGRNEWTRADSLLFGDYARKSDSALGLALEMFAGK